jgi:CubicO group peptidase (beta-lactamase class C family)
MEADETMRRRDLIIGGVLAAGGLIAARAPDASGLGAVLMGFDADEHPDLKGVVVRVGGAVVAERHYNGQPPDALHDMRSAGKSVTSLLVGAARDRGLIDSLADPVRRYWPEAAGSAIGDVALSDVLTMRSGLAADDNEPESPGNEDRLDTAPDPLAFVLAVPRATPPGSTYLYNSLTAYVAGLVVEEATGRQGRDFAREVLFEPLGITRFDWAADAAGRLKGQGNLSLATHDMALIGQMALDGGLAGGRAGGRQVISRGWIEDSLSPKVAIGAVDPYADGYGYFWYAKALPVGDGTVDIRFASGNGGNKIYIVPSRNMVVAVTSAAYGRGYGQRRSQAILTALLAAG